MSRYYSDALQRLEFREVIDSDVNTPPVLVIVGSRKKRYLFREATLNRHSTLLSQHAPLKHDEEMNMTVLRLENEDPRDFDMFYRWTTYAAGVLGAFRVPGDYRDMNRLYSMAIRIGACNHFKNALMDAFVDAAWFHESISIFRAEFLASSLRYTKVHKFYMTVMLSDLYKEYSSEEPRLTKDLVHNVVWEETVEDLEEWKKKNPDETEFYDRVRDKLRICCESHLDVGPAYPGQFYEEFHEHETADEVCFDTCMRRRELQYEDYGLEPNAN